MKLEAIAEKFELAVFAWILQIHYLEHEKQARNGLLPEAMFKDSTLIDSAHFALKHLREINAELEDDLAVKRMKEEDEKERKKTREEIDKLKQDMRDRVGAMSLESGGRRKSRFRAAASAISVTLALSRGSIKRRASQTNMLEEIAKLGRAQSSGVKTQG